MGSWQRLLSEVKGKNQQWTLADFRLNDHLGIACLWALGVVDLAVVCSVQIGLSDEII